MSTISQYLTEDHEHCDALFAEAENAVARGDWTTAASGFRRFEDDTLRHFEREEEILFPTFESRTGMTGGPTFVMRQEHGQMREVLAAMSGALERHDSGAYLGQSETLLMLMRQHNLKEEQILYPMCDRALADQADALVDRMEKPRP
ncbi:MAG: hemerythrin domain-containing protein [Thiobacillaceae bacterium]|jgi:hemerythrin-like domain-containing protein|nr:hemerythrin domain-containing protein [Thiobacillaceae bacterium]